MMLTLHTHCIAIILTMQTQYGDDKDSTHTVDSIVIILTLYTQYSDDIDSTYTV